MSEITACTLCTMLALLKGEPPEPFHGGPMEHAARLHPDPVKAQAEQEDLCRQMEERREMAAKARLN